MTQSCLFSSYRGWIHNNRLPVGVHTVITISTEEEEKEEEALSTTASTRHEYKISHIKVTELKRCADETLKLSA